MKIFYSITFLFLFFCNAQAQNFAQYVNPFIGTGGHGHTYPGATLPHGMVQLSPDTRLDGWDGCSGYHYSDSFIFGFTHTHLSGTGVSDYGDILLMPGNGKPSPHNKIYGSAFSHANEKASAGYYEVKLDDDNIEVALTATERVGYHRYTFTNKNEAHIILDLKHRDEVLASSLQIIDSVTVTGMRRSKAWATNQYVFFVMKFSTPFKNYDIWMDDALPKELISKAEGKILKAYFNFPLASSNVVEVKVAISPVSVDGAIRNLNEELPGWDFDATHKMATSIWNKELAKIEVQSTNTDKLKIFYTALYHTAIVPNINMDVDGQYRGMDDKIHVAKDFVYYSTFSLWDTYRAAHPLYTIIDRKRSLDYIKTFLVQYEQGGRLPVWELSSNETDCMIGYHSVPVIADAYFKGIKGFDEKLALQAMKKSATWDHLGLPAYMKKGLIEADDEHESVSKTLEYAYDDWCIAQFAKAVGQNEDYLHYMQRAQYYKNILNSKTGFVQPRSNGGWLTPFDPREVNNHFTEANSWQYSFYFPQDIEGYMKIMGGEKNVAKKLDALFAAEDKTTGRDQSDITGLIGQYAHGNEPSHHIIYLNNYAGQAHKTQFLVNKVMQEFYHNAPEGLIGNEDCGQMSAWYIFSALGFYPVTPGTNQYDIGRPEFEKATIHLENGKTFVIEAKNLAAKNIYVKQLQLKANNQPDINNRLYVMHEDIANGGKLSFTMTNQVQDFSKDTRYTDIAAELKNNIFVASPIIVNNNFSFKDKQTVTIEPNAKNTKVFYRENDVANTNNSVAYTKPLIFSKSLGIDAIAEDEKGNKSFVSSAHFTKRNNNFSISVKNKYSQQYDGGGPEALLDGIMGTANWRIGYWQGFQHNNFEATIDLKKLQKIDSLQLRFLQDTRAWIVVPKTITVYTSTDGINFKEAFKGNNFLPIEDLDVQVKTISVPLLTAPIKFIKIIAEQYGKLPTWHEGAGGDTHIFTDEINVFRH